VKKTYLRLLHRIGNSAGGGDAETVREMLQVVVVESKEATWHNLNQRHPIWQDAGRLISQQCHCGAVG